MRQPGEPSRHTPGTSNHAWSPSVASDPLNISKPLSKEALEELQRGFNQKKMEPQPNDRGNWVQIPNETMKELRRSADDRQRYSQYAGLLADPNFNGVPVHQIDGKWYVDLSPLHSRGLMTPDEARKALHIQEQLEVGTTHHDAARDVMRIWDGEQWFEAPGELLAQRGLLEQSQLTPMAIAKLKEQLVEWEEESERLALRQLLAESQQEGDDEAG